MESDELTAMESDEMKASNEKAEEVAAKLDARAQELDRKTGYFADDRASELDRAVANAEAFTRDAKQQARERIAEARADPRHRKGTPPA